MNTLQPLGEVEEDWGGATEVLFIGNSLSEDASQYLHLMAQADGNEKFNFTVTAVGGAGLTHHARNLRQELENPDYVPEGGTVRDSYFVYINGEGPDYSSYRKLTDMLSSKQFDVIAIQDYGNGVNDYNYDLANVTYMVNTLKQLQPNARIMLYETWSQNSSRGAAYMYRIAPWYKAAAEALDVEIIPSGRAFNLAQLSDAEGEGFNAPAPVDGNTDPEAQTGVGIADALGMYRDTDHASYYGRYLTDAVIYEAITGERVNPSFTVPAPTGVDASTHAANLAELREFAHQAVLEYK